MKGISASMRKTIFWFLIILMGVQIVLGAAYMVTNLGSIQPFAENYALAVPAWLFYLVQILFSASAIWYFLGKLGLGANRLLRGYVTAFLVTVPFLLQMSMALLPWSGALSALLWMLGLAMEIRDCGLSKKRGCLLGLFYFLYGILCPDGLWLGGILLLAVPVLYGIRKKNRLRYLLIVLFTACIVFMANTGFNKMWPEERGEYRYNSFGYAMASRFVWPNFSTNYYFWSEEVKQVLSEEDAVEISHRVDAVKTDFFTALEKEYGWKKANKLCLEMAYRCMEDRTKEVVSEIGTDFKDYLLMPFTIEENLRGEGTSLTAWNYGRMKAHTPLLVKYYFRYGFFELPLLLLGSILLALSGKGFLFGKQKEIVKEDANQVDFGEESITNKDAIMGTEKHRIPAKWRVLLFTGVFYVFWYTMRSNIPVDYKQVLPVLFIWYLAAAGFLQESKV